MSVTVTTPTTATTTAMAATAIGTKVIVDMAAIIPTVPTSGLATVTLPEQVNKHAPIYTSILTSPNRLKDVKAKLAAPVPVGQLQI